MRIDAVLAGLMLSVISISAHASDLVVTWVNPTMNTDGTPIPVTGLNALLSTRAEYGTCVDGAFGVVKASKVVLYPGNGATFNNVTVPATYCLRLFAKNKNGNESAPIVAVVDGTPVKLDLKEAP